MKHKLLNGLIAVALGTALAMASPAFAGRGGGGGGGGFGGHGGMGGMGAGMRGGMGGGMGFHAMGGPAFSGARFGTAPFAAHAAFAPGFSRGAFGPHFSHGVFGPRFAFRHGHFFHHRFRRFVFVGGPFYDYYGYDSCWRRVWTAHGPHWVNVCTDDWY